ncbi:unnamed protein product [Toxocara canis]|uniref:MAM domain-containing protein n=1 Tax=Toxocara canis TaxID=6265 RepID=A0A183UPQ8_TOXCA|nr:unnamed protein product [Toxocara canis]
MFSLTFVHDNQSPKWRPDCMRRLQSESGLLTIAYIQLSESGWKQRIWIKTDTHPALGKAYLVDSHAPISVAVVSLNPHSFPTEKLRSLKFLVILLVAAWSCMPGYGHERMKLKEYLGIEWVENGLDESGTSYSYTTQSDDKPIRHASDLDCRFDEPSECRWRNVKASEYLDTLDFFLFEKTDFTEFPVLQVRPGPSRLREGDKMIFTGDRKREEQTAIWRSSPIACQNTTGQLSFTFWLYNGARVEVVLFEKKDGRLRILPEKPFVDCGTVPLNTDCTADIPPRDTPFRHFIGIRAYNIANREGSFVMIDNIVYRTTLCKLSIDLGESFRGRPLITDTMMEEIESSDQLSCTDFDSTCRWRSVGHGKEAWQVAEQSPPSGKMFNATGTFIVPDAPFVYLYIEADRKAPFNMLLSDPIACQTEEESRFTFRFWATREAFIEVCATDLKGKELECHSAPMANSPAPVSFSFKRHESFTVG